MVVSSGAIRRVTDPSTLEKDLLAGSGKDGDTVYAETKFVQLLGAHWWRRQLRDTGCKVVAVSPGLIPGTGIGRGSGMVLSMEMKDAKSVDEGELTFFFPMVLLVLPQADGDGKKKIQGRKASCGLLRGTISPKILTASS